MTLLISNQTQVCPFILLTLVILLMCFLKYLAWLILFLCFLMVKSIQEDTI